MRTLSASVQKTTKPPRLSKIIPLIISRHCFPVMKYTQLISWTIKVAWRGRLKEWNKNISKAASALGDLLNYDYWINESINSLNWWKKAHTTDCLSLLLCVISSALGTLPLTICDICGGGKGEMFNLLFL